MKTPLINHILFLEQQTKNSSLPKTFFWLEMLRTKWKQKAFFLVICVMGLFAILSSTMSKNPVLKPFATSLGTPDDLLGIVASASTIPGILISLPAASLSDVFGRRKVVVVCRFCFCFCSFLVFGGEFLVDAGACAVLPWVCNRNLHACS